MQADEPLGVFEQGNQRRRRAGVHQIGEHGRGTRAHVRVFVEAELGHEKFGELGNEVFAVELKILLPRPLALHHLAHDIHRQETDASVRFSEQGDQIAGLVERETDCRRFHGAQGEGIRRVQYHSLQPLEQHREAGRLA